MICFGRTKESNYLKRCGRNVRFVFCRQHVWQLPAAFSAIVVVFAGLAQLSGFNILYFIQKPPTPPSPNIRVFFSEFYTSKPKSDMELKRGQRTLLFVWIPHLVKPIDRFILGAAFVRPVNVGSRSMSGAKLTIIYSKELWHPDLNVLEREAAVPVEGEHDFNFQIKQYGDDWISTRSLPRLDPMGGAPMPIFFILQMHGSTPSGEMNLNAKGDMEIRVTGPDWEGVQHVLHVRCVPAESEKDFISASQKIASVLAEDGFRDVPVVLALTAGKTLFSIDGGPNVIEARVDTLLSYSGR